MLAARRPERPNHVWSYDFMQDRTEDGRRFRMLTVIDEFTRRCLGIVVARKLRSDDVLHCLTDLIVAHGTPEHIRSDNGPEFVARNVRAWLGRIGVTTLYIEPGSPWENGYCESFNSKLRDALRNRFPPPLRGCFGIRVLFGCPSSHRFVPGAL